MPNAAIDPLLAFALTATIIELTPGPNMAYLASLSLSQGRRSGFAAVAGIALGLSVYGVLTALGLAALIDRSRWLYESLRWAGVAYLLWLAWEAWTSKAEASPDAAGGIHHHAASDDTQSKPWQAFRRGLITNLLNPKAAIFYVAVLPEFVRVDGGPLQAQTLMLSAVYVAIATAIHLIIVSLAGSLHGLVQTPARLKAVQRSMAVALLGIAIWFAVSSGR